LLVFHIYASLENAFGKKAQVWRGKRSLTMTVREDFLHRHVSSFPNVVAACVGVKSSCTLGNVLAKVNH
jgi:hypothetical protein